MPQTFDLRPCSHVDVHVDVDVGVNIDVDVDARVCVYMCIHTTIINYTYTCHDQEWTERIPLLGGLLPDPY